MLSTLETAVPIRNFALPPLETRFPPTSFEEAKLGMEKLAASPVLESPNIIRGKWTGDHLLGLIQGATQEQRLEERVLDLPDEFTTWLIGRERNSFQMQTVWRALGNDDMAMIVIKGGDVPILTDYLSGKRDDLPDRTELDFCPYVLCGTEEHLWDLWRDMGLVDSFDDILPTRTNFRLFIRRIFDANSILIGEAQHPHLNFAWTNIIDDVFLSPIRFLSARIIAANCRGRLRFFLFDPLGGINDWYGQVKPIAKPTDPDLLNVAEAYGSSWLGNGFPYAVSAIAYANAVVPDETVQFLARAYANSKKAALLRGDWDLVEQGIKAHISKLFGKLNSIVQEIKFLYLIESIARLADEKIASSSKEGFPI